MPKLYSTLGDAGPFAMSCDWSACNMSSYYSFVSDEAAQRTTGYYFASTSRKLYCPFCREACGKGTAAHEQLRHWHATTKAISPHDVDMLPVHGDRE